MPRLEVRSSKVVLGGLAPPLRGRRQVSGLLIPHVGALSGPWFRTPPHPSWTLPGSL